MAVNRVRADIDLDAVLYNMESMHKKLKPGTKIAAVVKADGYGHGAVEISRVLENLPYLWGYAVATSNEAMQLVEAGRKKPIIILGLSFPEQFEEIVENDLRPAVCTYETAQALSDIAAEKNKVCRIHIKVDTGMSRIGFQVTPESADTVARISKLPNIMIEGIFTHFARADESSKAPAYEQFKQFEKMIAMVEEKGVQIPLKHCSNSAGIVEIPECNMDMVRAGITLYGLWPSEEVDKTKISLKPVMSLRSRVAYVKELLPGRQISYGGTFTVKKKMTVATVPVGYGDGYARGLSNKGWVLIKGQKAPICGRVCMDQCMVDVTDIPGVKIGDTVTLLGKDADEEITMEQLGELSGRFNYEFACLITPRVPRIYHKNNDR
ncbi:MAG: alanine racemase [[Eubacterium] rectale]|nr:alanine racemase [uncultured Agathobacter sp.]MBD8926596.1 alanine racemase [Agathobacter rectalis]MEE1033765.1 alanine racemase [Agathobacter sp.]